MTAPNTQNARTSESTVPVIRQVALVMMALCLLVPALMLLRQAAAPAREHEPARASAALRALFDAIEVAPAVPPPLPDADLLRTLLPHCTGLPAYQGLPIMQDLAEQIALLDARLAGLTSRDGARNAPLRQLHHLNVQRWAQGVAGVGNASGSAAKPAAGLASADCAHAAQALRHLAGPRGASLLAQARWRDRADAPGQSLDAPAAVTLAGHSLAQTDPWRGWPGCIWLGGRQPGEPAYYLAPSAHSRWNQRLCEQPGMRPPADTDAPTSAQASTGSVAPASTAQTADATRGAAAGPAGATQPGAVPPRDDPAWSIPHDLSVLLADLEALRQPEGALYAHYVARLPGAANRLRLGRNEVDVGFNLQLTIAPRSQAMAQQVADCYTGSNASCTLIGVPLERVAAAQGAGAKAMWEQAAARMTSVAIIDVASGRIEALASAHTPCHAQENDGPFRDAGCLPLWTRPQRRPDALLNHAVFSDNLPGSTIKPILASVFFEDRRTPPEALALWLAKSDTQRFNDELFCINLPASTVCDRPLRAQQRAADLGWNADCTDRPDAGCARVDLLFGRRLGARLGDPAALPDGASAAPLQRPVLVGRLFVEPSAASPGQHSLMPLPPIARAAAAACRSGGQWHADSCESAAMKPLVNEAEGQGQARATALGVATMLARLTAAANGLSAVRRPHLIERISDAQGRAVDSAATRALLAAPEALGVPSAVARQVLQAMAKGTQALPGQDGTAHLICGHVFGARCAEIGARLAGKTGTPSFALDTHTLASARAFCQARPRDGACLARPAKWYVAAYASADPKGLVKDKVIAVMSERNWYRTSPDVPAAQRGRLHGTDDLNNISTEIAMRVLALQWGVAGRP